MDDNLGRDLKLSHDVLNYAHACLQGGFASLNMLSQMGYLEFNPDDLSRYQNNLIFLEKILNQLWQGLPVFSLSWKIPQTQEAKATLQLLAQLKQDLSFLAAKLDRIHYVAEPTIEDIKLLIGGYCRQAYTNENLIKGYIEFGRNFTMPHIIETYSPLLAEAERNIEAAHLYFDVFTSEESPADIFYKSLTEESVFLAGTFRSLVHDLNRFLATYKGPFTFALTDIPPDQAEEWQVIKIPPENAGYWFAFHMRAQEMVEWLQIGVNFPKAAFLWKCLGFDSVEAQEWVVSGIPAVMAREWKASKFTAKEAGEYVKQGVYTPEEAEKKRRFPDIEDDEGTTSDPQKEWET